LEPDLLESEKNQENKALLEILAFWLLENTGAASASIFSEVARTFSFR
jgi:hypothetical protein